MGLEESCHQVLRLPPAVHDAIGDGRTVDLGCAVKARRAQD